MVSYTNVRFMSFGQCRMSKLVLNVKYLLLLYRCTKIHCTQTKKVTESSFPAKQLKVPKYMWKLCAAMMSWVGYLLPNSELFLLFAENSQILLKVSVVPHSLNFYLSGEVWTFWEAHKNLRNLPHALYIYLVNFQTIWKIFFISCVLLRESEL